MGEGPAAAYHTKYYYNVLELGTFAAGEHVLALHLYYQGLVDVYKRQSETLDAIRIYWLCHYAGLLLFSTGQFGNNG